jgi:hypothetical protein
MLFLIRSAFWESVICFKGASAPSPDLLFVLTQKVSKKLSNALLTFFIFQMKRKKGCFFSMNYSITSFTNRNAFSSFSISVDINW